ncbi:MAG: hypothetical protein GY809_33505, partial [Planctomycetes bacterium]|nr:hypothetical protein [Planctomycetota bacterium]
MNRNAFIKLSASAMPLWIFVFLSLVLCPLAAKGAGRSTVPTRVISTQPPLRWEDAMISGNGSTGIMAMGLPLDDLIIVNHEKLWTVGNDYRPQTPDLGEAWKEAKQIAQTGRYLDADMHIVNAARQRNQALYGKASTGSRPRYDRCHPGLHLHVTTQSNGTPLDYRRETNLTNGEISVFWTDNRGDWVRRVFVSRTHNVIAMELTAPAGSLVNASLRLTEAPGKINQDIGSVKISYDEAQMYYHAAYGRTMGRSRPEGYHALARVIVRGGSTRAVADERLEIVNADSALMIMRFEYLDDAHAADQQALSEGLAQLPAHYGQLLDAHAAVHGEMFHRVSLDLGARPGAMTSETLIAQAAQGKKLAAFYELMHAMGRYALICGGTGDLAPSLMGLWGNEWTPPWDGRYTFDANLNLAMSAVSQGNLPEIMHTYTSFLERYTEDWRRNAQSLYGCDGVVTDLCQGWRHGAVLMSTYPWTGGAGWL